MKNIRAIIIAACCILPIVTAISACSRNENAAPTAAVGAAAGAGAGALAPLTAAELIELGERFLLELNFEQAIVHFLAAIEIEPRYERAYILLAEAYQLAGMPQLRQAILERGNVVVYDSYLLLEHLIQAVVDNGDAAAFDRILEDTHRMGDERVSMVRKLEILFESGNTGLMEEIVELQHNRDDNSQFALYLEIWIIAHCDFDTEDERHLALIELLDGRSIHDLLPPYEQLYFGQRDEEGRRHGFGIAFFGWNIHLDSALYVGYWENDVRSGQGIAFDRILEDIHRMGDERVSMVRKLEILIESGNAGFLEEVVELQNDRDQHSQIAMSLEIWIIAQREFESEEERHLALIELMRGKMIHPFLQYDEQLYFGQRDELGRRHGFGIAFYGPDVHPDSAFYIGYWEYDVRSGQGIAFAVHGHESIRGQWADDLPNGRLIHWMGGAGVEGTFADGLGYGIIYRLGHMGEILTIDLIAQTDVIQTFVPQPDIFSWKSDGELRENCPCVHTYWDVRPVGMGGFGW